MKERITTLGGSIVVGIGCLIFFFNGIVMVGLHREAVIDEVNSYYNEDTLSILESNTEYEIIKISTEKMIETAQSKGWLRSIPSDYKNGVTYKIVVKNETGNRLEVEVRLNDDSEYKLYKDFEKIGVGDAILVDSSGNLEVIFK